MLDAMRGLSNKTGFATPFCLMAFVIIGILSFAVCPGVASAQTPDIPVSESQVKALCLYNFAKYVEWPTNQFTNAAAPLSIGVIGNVEFAGTLKTLVQGKAINGHPVAIEVLKAGDDPHKCQILFFNSSENKRLADVLTPIEKCPILTVGEGEVFGQAGGIISFVVRNNRVRFDVDLGAASKARLQISARLLGLADAVHGKSP